MREAAARGGSAGVMWATANKPQDAPRPDYRKNMPLGMGGHSNVAPLGTNLRHQLETSAKRSNKFSSGFNPDHYL